MDDVTFDIRKNCLEKVIEFYKSKSIRFPKLPSIKYVDDPISSKFAFARLNHCDDAHEALNNFMTSNLMKNVYRVIYGLNLSDEAFSEINSIGEKRRQQYFATNAYNISADILVYKHFLNENHKHKETIMAHEVWHFIENERKLLFRFPLIIEYTADFAMDYYSREVYNKPLMSIGQPENPTLVDVLYRQGTDKLDNLLRPYRNNPLIGLLNKHVRHRLNKKVLGDFTSSIDDLFLLLDKEPIFLRRLLEAAEQITPEIQKLMGNLSKESIINFYREIGAAKTAEELEKQEDFSKMINFYQKLGYFLDSINHLKLLSTRYKNQLLCLKKFLLC